MATNTNANATNTSATGNQATALSLLEAIRQAWALFKERLATGTLFSPSYKALEEKFKEIDSSLDDLEQLILETPEQNKKQFEQLLQELNATNEVFTQIVKVPETNNLEEIQKSLARVDKEIKRWDDLQSAFYEAEAGTVAQYIPDPDLASMEEFFAHSSEEIRGGDCYINGDGLYLSVDGNNYKFTNRHGIWSWSSSTKIPSDCIVYHDLMEGFANVAASDLPLGRKADFLIDNAMSYIVRYNTVHREELENYYNLVSAYADEKNTTFKEYSEDNVDYLVRHNELDISKVNQTTVLKYSETDQRIELWHNNEMVANWTNENGSMKGTLSTSAQKVAPLLQNQYAYAFFEAHGISQEISKGLIKDLGKPLLNTFFPTPKGGKQNKNVKAVLTMLRSKKNDDVISKVIVDEKQGSMCCELRQGDDVYRLAFNSDGTPRRLYNWREDEPYTISKLETHNILVKMGIDPQVMDIKDEPKVQKDESKTQPKQEPKTPNKEQEQGKDA